MGPLVTAATVLGVNSLTGGEFIEHPLYLACVVYSVFRGGIGAGLASSALIVCDALIREIAAPFGLDEPFRHVKIVALACLVVVLVTGHLKRRADRASELSQVNRQLTGQLSERARSEEAAVALAADDAREAWGINDRVQLAQAAAVLRERTLDALIRSGVTVVDPRATYVDVDVTVGRDTTLLPGTMLQGNTRIGAGCTIGPYATIDNATIGDGASVRQAVVERATVEAGADIGPFAHILGS